MPVEQEPGVPKKRSIETVAATYHSPIESKQIAIEFRPEILSF